MSDVEFFDLWVNPMSNPAAGIPFSLHALEKQPAITIATTPFAAGNFRTAKGPGTQRVWKAALNFCTPAQVHFLEAYQGQMCCFRPPWPERLFGYIPDPDFTTMPGPVGTPTSFTIVESTYTGPG